MKKILVALMIKQSRNVSKIDIPSHVFPVKFEEQTHLKPFCKSKHVALFLHGDVLQ